MADDISTLGIGVDSTQVKRGTDDLDKLAAAGGRADKSVGTLTTSTGVLSRSLGVLTGVLASLGISKQRVHQILNKVKAR